MNSKVRGTVAIAMLVGGLLGVVAGIASALAVNHNREHQIPTLNVDQQSAR